MVSACKTIDTVVDVFFNDIWVTKSWIFLEFATCIEMITPWSCISRVLQENL